MQCQQMLIPREVTLKCFLSKDHDLCVELYNHSLNKMSEMVHKMLTI